MLKKNSKSAPDFPQNKKKPFSQSDFKEIPLDWNVNGPGFIGVGTIKSGTSWWYSLLLDHPQIVPNRLKKKELRYFVHFGYTGLSQTQINTYTHAFAAPPGSICGEWSPVYFSHPLGLKHISKAAPNTKILISLRNPIDRIVSFLNEAMYGSSAYHFNPEQLYVFSQFSIYPNAMLSSLYADNLRRLFQFYDRKQILILQYEKCCKDPESEIARTYRFLELDDQHVPAQLDRKVNQKKYLIPKLKPDEKLRLKEFFTDDVQKAFQMCPEIEPSLWEEFADLS